jgi:hypothetical protein
MRQTLSSGAQINTISFSGVAFYSGCFYASTFYPPGKVADYFGFQYLRDNDLDESGHNTDFLTKVAYHMMHILNPAQLLKLIDLAVEQESLFNQYVLERLTLIKAFHRYLGNDLSDMYMGKRENYYSWSWGDALFVVIDPYANTITKPTDGWGFTLGKVQYDWFRSTLENSKAKFKFVFSHQIVGGDNLGRGGSEQVDFFEMGGKNADGSNGFDAKRPGWGKPIHQIMVENGVQIFFHGHDHLYVEQPKDGIVYLEVPQLSLPQYTNTSTAAGYGYLTGTLLPCSGHINVTVSTDSAKVDYIGGYHANNISLGQVNGTIRRTFSVKAKVISEINTPVGNTNTFQVYPSGKTVFLKSDTNTKVQLRIFDLTGICISTTNIQLSAGTQILDLPSKMNHGLFLLNFSSDNLNQTIKIAL